MKDGGIVTGMRAVFSLLTCAALFAPLTASARYVIRARCNDGVPSSVVAHSNREKFAVPTCDADSTADRRCTFQVYFGCEAPLQCLGLVKAVSVPVGGRRRVHSPPGPQTYVLRCRASQ